MMATRHFELLMEVDISLGDSVGAGREASERAKEEKVQTGRRCSLKSLRGAGLEMEQGFQMTTSPESESERSHCEKPGRFSK